MSKIARSNTSLNAPIDSTSKEIMSTITMLEDNSLERTLMKSKSLTCLLTQLEKYNNVETKLAERILALCIQELNVDVKNLANFASILSILIKKIMVGKCPYPSNLMDSAKSIVKALIMLKSNSAKTDTLRSLCYETLQSYPDEIMTNLAMDEFQMISDLIMAIVTKPSSAQSDFPHFFTLLQKILNILPIDKKTEFVKTGISLWFGLLPSTLQYITAKSDEETILAMQVFESLTDELVNFDYTDNVKWNIILQSISQSNKYPACLKALLENGNQNWHRLWMIFIRLLKTQIIKVSGPGGSPINSMLPVVEHAFKLDFETRCRAFECWNVLIDNFSSATNDLVVNKKVKLLIIPLKSNNAKHEKTAIAKFHTWWHLIRRFSYVLDKYVDTILIPFLHYCFGNSTKSIMASSAAPGQQTKVLKQLSIQALVEIIGHVRCESCIDLPKLSNKILNTQLLVTYWKDWIYSFKTALVFLSTEYVEKYKQWLSCLWTSLISTLGQLPENNVRKDLIDEVLQIWMELIQDEKQNLQSACIILDILIPSFVLPESNTLIELLLNMEKNNERKEVHKIIKEIVKLSNKLLQGCDSKTLIHKLKPLVFSILPEGCNTLEDLNDSLPAYSDNPLILWTVMAENMFETHNYMNDKMWHTFLKWPLINTQKSTFDARYAASAWLKIYVSFKVSNLKLDNELLDMLQNNYYDLDIYFRMNVALALLKYNLQRKSDSKCNLIQKLLNNNLSVMEDYEQIQDIMPMLIDSLSLLLNKLISSKSLAGASNTLLNVKHVLRLVNYKLKNNVETDDINIFLQNIFKLLDILFKIPEYQVYIAIIADELTEYYKFIESNIETRAVVSNLLKLSLQHLDNATKVEKTLTPEISSDCKPDETVDSGFLAPDIKKPVKAMKDKGPKIMNTVLVDGEEFVVLKPQWKFNPKNLTENQKEKFKRKRDDIPALYQDLSQSQDEFKLSKWKTDSQDTSSISSKSASNIVGDTSTILQNIPHTDLVPNIMESLMSDTSTKDSNLNNSIKKNLPTPKSNNKPRMALKDRILRNVRNLLENSSLNNEPCSGVDQKSSVTTSQEVKISNEINTPKTPNNRLQTIMNAVHAASASKVIPEKLSTETVDNKKIYTSKPSDEDLLKSAPAKLCAERPSRAKRKPKKFDDSQLIELKRRRPNTSLNESQSESQEQSYSDVVPDQKSLDKSDNLKNNYMKLDNNNKIHEIIPVDSECENDVDNLVTDHKEVQTEYNPIANTKNVKTKIDDHPEIVLDLTVDFVVEIDDTKKMDIAPETRIQNSEQACSKESCSPNVQSQKETGIIISSCSPSTYDKTNASLDESKSVLELATHDSGKVVQSIEVKLSDKEKDNKSENLNCNVVEAKHYEQKETTHISTSKNKDTDHDCQKMSSKQTAPIKLNKKNPNSNGFEEKNDHEPNETAHIDTTKNKEKEHDKDKNHNCNAVEAENYDEQKETTHMTTTKNKVIDHESQTISAKNSINKEKEHENKNLMCNVVEAKNDDEQKETTLMSTPKNKVMKHSKKMSTKKSASNKSKNKNPNSNGVAEKNDDEQKETAHAATPKSKVNEHDSQKISTKKITSNKEKEHDKSNNLNSNAGDAENDEEQIETTKMRTHKFIKQGQKMSNKKSASIKAKNENPNNSEVDGINDDEQKETTQISAPKNKVNEQDSHKMSTKNTTSNEEKEHESKNLTCTVIEAKNDDDQVEITKMSTPKNKVIKHGQKMSNKKTASNKINKKNPNNSGVETINDDEQKESTQISAPKNIVNENNSTTNKEKEHESKNLTCNVIEAKNDDEQIDTTQMSTPKNKVIKKVSNNQIASNKINTKKPNNSGIAAINHDEQEETTEISTPKNKLNKQDNQKMSTKKITSNKEKVHGKSKSLNCNVDDVENDDKQKESTHATTPQRKVMKNEHDNQNISTQKLTSNTEKVHESNNLICNVVEAKNDEQKNTVHMTTPKNKVMKRDMPKMSTKKSTPKISHIERQLAIDTVEGHPLLSKSSSRRNRKRILDLAKPAKKPRQTKKKEAVKEINDSQKEDSITINETQDKCSQESCSEDVIESSQDSSITTISVTSTKVLKKVPIVALERHGFTQEIGDTQSLLDNIDHSVLVKDTRVSDVKDDTVFPENKTASEEHDCVEITANLDTEPMDHDISDDVILISDEPTTPTHSTEGICCDLNTEEIANADTQSLDPNIFTESPMLYEEDNNDATITLDTQELMSQTDTEPMTTDTTSQNSESPQKDEIQRKQDFLNNTLEISPIKIQSPLRDQKTPSPDTSKDFVVIKLTSPVNSNGEPLEKSNSPEIFSEDKGSPDKRDLSPPREEPVLNNMSPSSSLSLKKNRPQVRTYNRAAQMLGLCVSNNTESVSIDRLSDDELKRITPLSTPVRKNLKMLYNNVPDNETVEESEDSANFLKLKRLLPAVDSSPVGPILKRKLVDMADEATISPANKRKRVSFHDPPVSTTVSVHKYIEPGVTRSPQNSLSKRKERERLKEKGKSPNMKLPKRLDSVFKLDTALTKAVESFSENDTTITSSNDTQMSSMEPTPVVEIVRISDLDDKEPICLDLIECEDPISKIAIKLSSPAMYSLLIKEFEGKIETIGDLAKLTELEVNRLCIKSPKVSITKKVLLNYFSKWKLAQAEECNEEKAETQTSEAVEMPVVETMDVELQTETVDLNSTITQTEAVITCNADAQTNIIPLSAASVQTVESGSKSTEDIVHTCISEKPDFIEKLRDILDEPSKKLVAEKLPFNSILQLLLQQTTADNSVEIIDQVLTCNISSSNTLPAQMLFLQSYLCKKFDSKDLVLFCSKLLQKIYDKPT